MTIADLPTIPTLTLTGIAAFRLAYLITKESGPMFVFLRLRKAAKKQGGSVAEGSECPYCVGVWASAALYAYLASPWRCRLGDAAVVILGIAGCQLLWHQLFTFLRRE